MASGIRRLSAAVSTAALSLALVALPGQAFAQDAGAPPEPVAPADVAPEPPTGEEIIVTGSRIARTGFTAPTPVTMVGGERLEQLGASNVGDAIQQLPSVLPSVSAQTAGVSVGAGGFRTIDLRGLGATRTLVLVDGRRFVPSTAQGTVDVNLIPAILLDRVEIVTGGASAAYGSDAVSGVANFILNRRLEGLRATASAGISQEGDDRDILLSLAGGTSFAGGAGHIVLGGEYHDNSGVGNCYRDAMPNRRFCQGEWQVLTNSTPGVNGYPAFYVTDHVHTGLLAQGGVINTPAMRGTQFDANGQPVPFEYGILSGLFMGGGSGHNQNPFRTAGAIKVPVDRVTAFGLVNYDLGGVNAFLEGSYGRVHVVTPASQIRDTALVIRRDNPFLPTSIVERMTQLGLQSINVGRAGDDLGFAMGDNVIETTRVAGGLSGALASLQWDAYYQYGRTDFRQRVFNNRHNANFTRAIDAVVDPATGQITCRSLLSPDPAVRAAAAGCVPLNIIGINRFSPEAKAYTYGTSEQDMTLQQHIVAANLRGDLVDLWAGPLSFAAGAEYRRDMINGTTDPVSETLNWYIQNGTTFDSLGVTVKEAYAEALLPLARDIPFARLLELNGAVRYTDYSTSGGVTTWKVGGIWEPVSEIRVRATRSRDIRAPNVQELFSPTNTNFSSILDRRTGVNTLTPILRGGNAELTPEIADTFTVGAVFSPVGGFLDGLRLSVDYYDIQIRDAIGTVGAQTIANRCFEGAQEFCALLEFENNDPNGVISRVTDRFVNVNELKTRGLDFELAYTADLGTAGRLSLRGLATHVMDLITTDSAGSVNRAGQTGVPVSAIPGIPDWTFDGTITWDLDPFSLTFHGRYIAEGKYDVTLIGPDDPDYDISLRNSINDNIVSDYFIANLSARFNVNENFQFFGAVNNLFNRTPPLAPGSQGYTNAVLFDQVMRTFRFGVRVRM